MEIKVGSKIITDNFMTGALEAFTVKAIFYCIDSSCKTTKDKKAFLASNNQMEKVIFENEINSVAIPYPSE